MRAFVVLSCLSGVLSMQTYQAYDYYENKRSLESNSIAVEEPSILDSFLGEDASSRVIENIFDWAKKAAGDNPICVERLICESYRYGEGLEGITYAIWSITNAAASFIVAEQFGDVIPIQSLTRAAKYGRTDECLMKCPVIDNQLRTITNSLAGVEEILAYVVDSIATSLG